METPIQTSLRRMFRMYLEQNQKYYRASRLARQNSSGGLWLIGGSVFRTLAYLMYGTPMPKVVDFDFLVDSLREPLIHPGWERRTNRYGNPKFVDGDESFDLMPIKTTINIIRRRVPPTVENFLDAAPFTAQMIALNCLDMRLVDRGGIQALLDREIKVNDPEGARILAERKSKTVLEVMVKLTAELQFKCVV